MKIRSASVCVLGALACALAVPFVAGSTTAREGDETRSAREKLYDLREKIEGSSYLARGLALPTEGPGVWDMLKLFSPSFLRVSFLRTSDEMPEGRLKLIHTYGVTGAVDWEPDVVPHPYSGVLSSGGIGVIRLSIAKASGSFTPGLGLKILLDGRASVNVFAMPSLDGQGDDHRFFARQFRTRIGPPSAPGLKLLALAFSQAVKGLPTPPAQPSPEGRTIPIDELASVTANGLGVAEPRVPALLTFIPAIRLPQPEGDFRVQLEGVPAGTVLFHVVADESQVVGRIVTRAPLVASEYGDSQLYFRHPRRGRPPVVAR